jgi:uncharacterized RDD family membrane protein YckC
VPELVVETTEGVRLRRTLAGAGSRALAALIDLAIYALVSLALFLGLMLLMEFDTTGLSAFVWGLAAGGSLLLLCVYQVGFATLWNGQTPGKRLAGLRALDAHGVPASALQHVLRGLFWPLECVLFVPIPLGLLLIAATERRQRLGDLVAGTLVLREEVPREPPEPYPLETWSRLARRQLPLVPALAGRFDAEDRRFLRALLARRGLDTAAADRLAVRAARHYAVAIGAVAPQRPDVAREHLRELYLFLREMRAG